MRTCPKCGSYLPENAILCPSCNRLCINVGKNVQDATKSETRRRRRRLSEAKKEAQRDDWTLFSQEYSDTHNAYEQHTSHMPGSGDYYNANPYASQEVGGGRYDSRRDSAAQQKEAQKERVISAVGYFGILFFLPLVLCPKSDFARFHANQALAVLLLSIGLSIVGEALAYVMGYTLVELLTLIPTALTVYGAVTAIGGKMNPLPVIGSLQLIKRRNGL